MRVLSSNLPGVTSNGRAVTPYLSAAAVTPLCNGDLFFSDKRRHNDEYEDTQYSTDQGSERPRLLHQPVP